MELYTLNSAFRREAVIDRFESMIWTERFSAWGDFELHLFSTPEMRRLLPAGTRLAMSDSFRVMSVELVEDNIDADGKQTLKVSGRSLEAILDERLARNTFTNLAIMPKWVVTGTPGDICRQIFNEICRTNVNFADDQIPYLMTGLFFGQGNIPEPNEVITLELGLTTVYKALKEICEAYDLGFRLVRNFDESELYFDIYSGNDRTTAQSILAPVVFAPNLDNLTNVSEITSTGNYRNVAYVFHPYGVQIVISDGASEDVEGFDRRVLPVDASDIDLPDRPYSVTEAQDEAIKAAISATEVQEDKDALTKLQNRSRLLPNDITIITTWGTTSSLSAGQKAEILGARDVSTTYADTLETPWLNMMLQQRGKDELAKNRRIRAFDGELPTSNIAYKYDYAYQLGDLVEMRNNDGVTNQMRVTEQIFVSDSEGERTYPTLTLGAFVTPGSWISYHNEVWESVDGEWSEQP